MFARAAGPYLTINFSTLTVVFGVGLILEGLWWLLTVAYVPLFLFQLWFFRDPERQPGPGIVSPADGKVLSAVDDASGKKLTIFMAPTSVHVNRAPLEGSITRTEYRQGAHVPAFKKESVRNERFDLELSTAAGSVSVALIAGTVARRIHPYVIPGNQVKKGDRIGLIAFGSRCELVLPPGPHRWVVRPGQWIRAGETTVAIEG